jgi:hypothetical protein
MHSPAENIWNEQHTITYSAFQSLDFEPATNVIIKHTGPAQQKEANNNQMIFAITEGYPLKTNYFDFFLSSHPSIWLGSIVQLV